MFTNRKWPFLAVHDRVSSTLFLKSYVHLPIFPLHWAWQPLLGLPSLTDLHWLHPDQDIGLVIFSCSVIEPDGFASLMFYHAGACTWTTIGFIPVLNMLAFFPVTKIHSFLVFLTDAQALFMCLLFNSPQNQVHDLVGPPLKHTSSILLLTRQTWRFIFCFFHVLAGICLSLSFCFWFWIPKKQNFLLNYCCNLPWLLILIPSLSSTLLSLVWQLFFYFIGTTYLWQTLKDRQDRSANNPLPHFSKPIPGWYLMQSSNRLWVI